MKTLNYLLGMLMLSILLVSCDKNEHAPVVVDQEFSVEENPDAGRLIGVIDASDGDEGQVVSYEIIDGNPDASFEIDPKKGVISVANPAKINFEEHTEFILSVLVTDNHDKEPLGTSAKIKISVIDVNEFAPSISNQGFSMDENPTNGQEVGLVQARDEDIHQNLTFSIIGSVEHNYLIIDSETGILTVKDSLGFDYESADHMSFMVKVVDDHKDQLADSATITILIQDVGTKHALIMQPGPSEGRDAFVEDYAEGNYSNRNFGDLEEFSAISWTASGLPFLIRSFIDFEFSPIPEGAVIDSAKLSFFAHGNVAHGDGHAALDGTNEFYLRRVISAWDEHTITWNNQPETTSLSEKLVPASTDQHQDYTGLDITALVRDMYANPSESFGFMLSLKTEEGFKRVFFASSDVPDENKRPKIEIYYSVE
jgi:hypothetical protein